MSFAMSHLLWMIDDKLTQNHKSFGKLYVDYSQSENTNGKSFEKSSKLPDLYTLYGYIAQCMINWSKCGIWIYICMQLSDLQFEIP